MKGHITLDDAMKWLPQKHDDLDFLNTDQAHVMANMRSLIFDNGFKRLSEIKECSNALMNFISKVTTS
jgi:hypothetical protein